MPAASPRSAARPHPRPVVRWDRIGRLALLLVLAGMIALYVSPVRDWWSTMGEKRVRAAEVQRLQREHDRLAARRAELRDPRAVEREARRLGMVKPGERAFVVDGLP